MQRYVNKCEVMVNAVQRSGHHAFILELLAATDRHLFLNCVKGERIYFAIDRNLILNVGQLLRRMARNPETSGS